MKNPFVSTHSDPHQSGRRTLVASALALTLATGIAAGPVLAQDGTGAATPTPPSACEVVPARATFDAATPDTVGTVTAAMTPVASPAAQRVLEGASPVAAGISTPLASPVTETTVTDPLARDLEATATAIAGCLSDERYETLVQITGDLYRGQMLGLTESLNADDFTTLAVTLPDVPYQILSVENATFTDETTATAVVTYEMAHQVRTSLWEFSLQEVNGQNAWVLERETPMASEIPANTSTLQVSIEQNAYTLNPTTVQGPSVALSATNNDEVGHELLVLRLEDGATTQTLLQSPGPSLPENVTFIGQVFVPAGEEGMLLLAGLQPGTYTIVDLLPNAEGLPNLAGGMEATFTVSE